MGLLIENPSITREEICNALSITKKQVGISLKFLTDKQVIERTGGKRYGKWEVKDIYET